MSLRTAMAAQNGDDRYNSLTSTPNASRPTTVARGPEASATTPHHTILYYTIMTCTKALLIAVSIGGSVRQMSVRDFLMASRAPGSRKRQAYVTRQLGGAWTREGGGGVRSRACAEKRAAYLHELLHGMMNTIVRRQKSDAPASR